VRSQEPEHEPRLAKTEDENDDEDEDDWGRGGSRRDQDFSRTTTRTIISLIFARNHYSNTPLLQHSNTQHSITSSQVADRDPRIELTCGH
jgi:hypothetical protein